MSISPKLRASIQAGGGRIYGGHRPSGPWQCPACGSDQVGPIERGCTTCRAGDPTLGQVQATKPTTTQERRAGAHPTYDGMGSPARPALRLGPDPAVLAQFEQRLLAAIDQRLAAAIATVQTPTLTLGDLPDPARRTIGDALTTLISLVEQDIMDLPAHGLDLDQIRQLALLFERPEDFTATPITSTTTLEDLRDHTPDAPDVPNTPDLPDAPDVS